MDEPSGRTVLQPCLCPCPRMSSGGSILCTFYLISRAMMSFGDCLLAEAALESLLGEESWAGCQQWNLPQILCFLPPLLSPGSILVLLTYLALLGCRPRQKAKCLPHALPQAEGDASPDPTAGCLTPTGKAPKMCTYRGETGQPRWPEEA